MNVHYRPLLLLCRAVASVRCTHPLVSGSELGSTRMKERYPHPSTRPSASRHCRSRTADLYRPMLAVPTRFNTKCAQIASHLQPTNPPRSLRQRSTSTSQHQNEAVSRLLSDNARSANIKTAALAVEFNFRIFLSTDSSVEGDRFAGICIGNMHESSAFVQNSPHLHPSF